MDQLFICAPFGMENTEISSVSRGN